MSAPTVKCENCNQIIDKNYDWCKACGKRWKEVPTKKFDSNLVCKFCGARGTIDKYGWCSKCGKENPNEETLKLRSRTPWEKFKDTMSCLAAIGYGSLSLFSLYIIITVGIPACNDVMPSHPVTDWMQNQKYEREEHERRREEQ